MNDSDLIRLRHMLDACREARVFMDGRTSDDLQRDRMFLLALVKEIEIVGEAANRISAESRAFFQVSPGRWLLASATV